MNRCDEQHTGILPYLDNALAGQALEGFRAHLADCSDCSERLEEERAFVPPAGNTAVLMRWLLQPICGRCRRRRSALRRSHISLAEWRKLPGNYLGQSWSYIRTAVLLDGFTAALLPGLPSGHGGPKSLQTLSVAT